MDLLLIIFTIERTFFRRGLSFAVGGHWILKANLFCKSPGGGVVDTKGLGSCDVAKSVTFELGYNVMKGTEYFLSLQTSVAITEEYYVMAKSKELIRTTEYLSL
jgi:hypothetical protein